MPDLTQDTYTQIDSVESIDRVREHLLAQGAGMPRALVHSFGCQQNVSDGEKIKGMLAQMGYGFTDDLEEADLVLYNTCAVRENAEDRVFGNIGILKHRKKQNPQMIIALCGCMMQQEHIAKKIRQSYPFVDIVFGTHAMHRLPQMLDGVLSGRRHVVDIADRGEGIVEGLPIRRDGTLKAWLPVMYGCDNFCTYCVVPYVRGRERSRSSAAILEEAKSIIAAGYKEIMLLGQNVNSYGKGLEEKIDFPHLLEQINALPGDFRIRFMTSHPKDCTKALIDTIARCKKVCNHIHLPVQCGSDRILKQMNRHYTVEDYKALLAYAREKIPDVLFSSDIIVGFPGESYQDFQKTLDLIRKVGFSALYTFIYSRRVGTRAAEMDDPVPPEEKSRWFRELLEVQQACAQPIYDAMVGKTYTVLPEGPGKSGEGYLTGRTGNNMIVEFKAPPEQVGRFTEVTITRAPGWALEGIMK